MKRKGCLRCSLGHVLCLFILTAPHPWEHRARMKDMPRLEVCRAMVRGRNAKKQRYRERREILDGFLFI